MHECMLPHAQHTCAALPGCKPATQEQCWLSNGKGPVQGRVPKRKWGAEPHRRIGFQVKPKSLSPDLHALEMMLPRRRRRASCTLAAAFLHGRSMRRRSRMVRTPYRRISSALHVACMGDSMSVYY